MSDDIAVTPASAPSSPPSEAAIETNPVNLPTPVGAQAPDKPVGDIKGSEHRPQSRREAIQAAYERALNHPPRDKPKTAPKATPEPVEAKAGHNQPPEETEKLDLKKRPSEQPRGERGRFAPQTGAQIAQTGAQTAQTGAQTAQTGAQTAQNQDQALQPNRTPYSEPPPRMAEHAKKDWATVPESVRGEIHRMHQEFGNAYNFYRADHEAMKPLRPFHQLAQSQGTTLERALSNYVGIEQKLRADPVAGLDMIVNNLALKTPDGQQLGLRDIAYHVLNQSPEQLRSLQQGNAQTAASQQIGSLYQEIAGLKGVLHQMYTERQFGYSRMTVDQYAADHPRFDELSDLIEREIRLGFDLDVAYRRAELLRPAPHAAQTRTQSAQTRTTDRSISGAPAGPASNGTGRRSEKPVGRREAIQHAIKSVNGSL